MQSYTLTNLLVTLEHPSKHVYMGPIWAESGHLSHSGLTEAPYRLFLHIKDPYRSHSDTIRPTNMYMWEPYEQILGIYPIRVLNGPHTGFLPI